MTQLQTCQSVLEMIAATASRYPHNQAVGVHTGDGFTFVDYENLWALINRVASGLLARGIERGDRVALLLADRAAWGVVYLGVLRAGAVVVPIDNLQKPHEWAAIVKEANARAIVADTNYGADLKSECAGLPVSKNWIDVEADATGELASRLPRELVDRSAVADFPAVSGDETAALVFTSGTTSAPKGVILTHRNLASDVEAIHGLGICRREDCFLSVLPIHHTFECTVGLLNPLTLGCTIAYARSLKSREIMEDLRASAATVIIGVPLLFEKIANAIKRGLNKQPAFKRALVGTFAALAKFGKSSFNANLGRPLFRSLREKAGLGTLRMAVSGGAALPPEVGEFMDRLGLPILQGYGLTETSPALSVNPAKGYKYDTVGPPLPGIEMKIVDPDADGVGEIAARGEMVTPGYYNRPEETAKLFADGWLLTGDLGWKDDDGHYHITGRAKNVIVTPAGKNVYPEEIEMLLAESPLILEALVYGETKPGETRERIGCAVVPDLEYLEADRKIVSPAEVEKSLLAEAQRICAGLADYKRPTEYIVCDTEFEKTSTKKIKRFLFARTKEEQFPLEDSENRSVLP